MHKFKFFFGFVGLITGLFVTPVPYTPLNFACTGFLYSPRPNLSEYAAQFCYADQQTALIGGAVALLVGIALGAFADSLLSKKRN